MSDSSKSDFSDTSLLCWLAVALLDFPLLICLRILPISSSVSSSFSSKIRRIHHVDVFSQCRHLTTDYFYLMSVSKSSFFLNNGSVTTFLLTQSSPNRTASFAESLETEKDVEINLLT